VIDSDAGLKTTRSVLAHFEDALRGLNSVRAKYHPTTFALLADPIVEAIQTHRAEIDEYIGLTAAVRPAPPAAAPADGPLVGA